MTGHPRPAVASLPAYVPGKAASQAEAEHGIENAIKLASNETPWGPLPSVVEAMTQSLTDINRYADHRAAALRESVAGWTGVASDQVTIGCGSVGILQQLVLSYVDPGDDVVYPWRSFEIYPVFTQLAGGNSIQVPLVDEAFDLDAVAAAVTDRTKLVMLANPNNPTGTAIAVDELRAFAEKIPSDVIIAMDEAYHEFMDPSLGDTVSSLLPDFANLIILRTFSKAQGLAALRAGYAMAHPELIATIDKTQSPFSINGIAQAAAIASIEAHDEIMQRVSELVVERDRVASALADRGYRLPRSEANFVWLPLGQMTGDVHLELEKAGVVTRPFPGEGLRVTIGTAEENDRFLAAL